MAGSLLQRQESQVLCVVAGWHLAHFETHLIGPRNYPTFPHSWHLPTASTDTTGVSARDWGRGAAHADEAIKTVGARDSAQADHRRHTGEASAWYSGDQRGPAGTKTQSVPPTQEARDALRGTPASYTEPSETEGNQCSCTTVPSAEFFWKPSVAELNGVKKHTWLKIYCRKIFR